MTFALHCLAVFVTSLAAALCWPLYIRYCEARQAWRAAVIDCVMIALGMIAVTGWVEDARLAGPALLGAFIGTYLVVRK